jgi:hypothetical protein
MDDYMFFRDDDGWIESNIHIFMDHFMVKQTVKALSHTHHHRMDTWLYDSRPHPTYPYVKAQSAYSALVQLYARSGQLPTASGLKQKKNTEDSRCRYGCEATESMFHVFVVCGKFKALREEARGLIQRKVEKRFDGFNVGESHVVGLREAAKFLFYDSDISPLQNSVYYLGHVPKLDPIVSIEAFNSTTICEHFLHNIHGDFHMAGIYLTSRIWGLVQKDMARRREGIIVSGMRS